MTEKILIPKDWREKLNLKEKEEVEIQLKEDNIIIIKKKYIH
jgi:AbrB family looped-hinge helix DNA binding protein